MLLYLKVSVVYIPHVAEAQQRKPCIYEGGESKRGVTHLEDVLFPGLKPIYRVLLPVES